jgi:hypothetical protein
MEASSTTRTSARRLEDLAVRDLLPLLEKVMQAASRS